MGYSKRVLTIRQPKSLSEVIEISDDDEDAVSVAPSLAQ